MGSKRARVPGSCIQVLPLKVKIITDGTRRHQVNCIGVGGIETALISLMCRLKPKLLRISDEAEWR